MVQAVVLPIVMCASQILARATAEEHRVSPAAASFDGLNSGDAVQLACRLISHT
jgi:hypothetical protein